MATEIERKFLLLNDGWRNDVSRSQRMCQGYLSGGERGSVRVRVAGEQAWLNIKSATIGVQRLEYEYPIPLGEAEEILQQLCGLQVDKTRHYIEQADLIWEIDEFHGENAGLIVAEIELPAVDSDYPRPDWLGEEVSTEVRYYNNELAKNPYKNWQTEQG